MLARRYRRIAVVNREKLDVYDCRMTNTQLCSTGIRLNQVSFLD